MYLAIARVGQPGSVWRSAGPVGVGASLTIREQSSREAVLRHRLLRHQGLQVRRLILVFFETSSRPEFFKKKTDFLCDSVSSVGWRLNSPPAPSTTTTTTAAVFDLCLGFSTKPDFSGTSLQLHCDCSSPEVPRSSLLFDKAASTSSLARRQ